MNGRVKTMSRCFLQNEVKENLTECWFEINELKEDFRTAVETLPKTQVERPETCPSNHRLSAR